MYAVKKFQFEQKIETRCERGEKFLLNILFKKEINAVYALEYALFKKSLIWSTIFMLLSFYITKN